MKRLCLLLLLGATITAALQAQDNSKYLKGAIKQSDGKVIFNRVIKSDLGLADASLFDKINQWVDKNYNLNDGKTQNRILVSDKNKNQIGCMGETALVLGRRLLSADTSPMTYQLIIEIKDGNCDATIRGIRYQYSDGKQDEIIKAEDMITDKLALNKAGDKLANYYGKFRKVTIDSIETIFNSLEKAINREATTSKQIQYIYIDKSTGEQVPQPTRQIGESGSNTILEGDTAKTSNPSTSLAGYKNISVTDIPNNYINLLDNWNLITSGKNKVNTMTASWGGIGTFWNKPVTFCFLNPTRYSIKTMDEGETYTISFFGPAYKDILSFCGTKSGLDTDKIKGSGLTTIRTPSGATAFSEAWLIIECRKIIAQPISEAAVKIDQSEINKKWTKDGLHKMYIGEILNVWIK